MRWLGIAICIGYGGNLNVRFWVPCSHSKGALGSPYVVVMCFVIGSDIC